MRKRKKMILIAVLAGPPALAVAAPALAAATNTTAPAASSTATCGGYGRGNGFGAQMSTEIAAALKMDPTALQAERQAGKSLAQIAQAQGVSTDTLTAAMLDAHKATVANAVKDGRITQAQADLMLQNMSSRVAERINDTATGPFGGSGGHGRGGQGMCAGTVQ